MLHFCLILLIAYCVRLSTYSIVILSFACSSGASSVNSFAEQYDVKNAKEFWRLEKTLSEWKISCLVEEALTPKGETVTYCTEKVENPLDFFSER